MYQVWSKDGFDTEAEPFHLGAWENEIATDYGTYGEALESARKYLQALDIAQPDAGGQDGIQDRVYVRHPDGRLERITS